MLARLTDEIILPTAVVVETTYLLRARLGYEAMRQFIQRLSHSPLSLVAVIQEDLPRIYDLLAQYADIQLDYVDAANIALAERLNIRLILTVDQRDFRTARPKHCDYFDILP